MKRQYWSVLSALLLTALLLAQVTFGAQAARNQSFGGLDLTFDPGAGANDAVFAVARLSDGDVLIGGQFTQVNNVTHSGIARLDANGSLDPSYTASATSTGFSGITSMAIQPADGKVVIGGLFTQVNGTARVNIARLDDSGALDTSFNPGTGVTDPLGALVNVVKLQPDGRVLIGGYFTGYDGTARNHVARLTITGALDATFDPGSGPNNEVDSMAVQPSDGKVLIGGYFTTVNGVAHGGLARLNTDGSVDATFNPTVGGAGQVSVLAMAVQSNNKILIGGNFTTVNGIARNYIARLNSDGNLDTSFDPNAANEVDAITVQPDGKIVIGGRFTKIGSIGRVRLARLYLDGSVDVGLNPGAGVNYVVFALALQPDGKVLIGGAFTTVDNVPRNYIARMWGSTYLLQLPLIRK